MVVAVVTRGAQVDHPLPMILCGLYIMFAIMWLWIQGMGGPSVGRRLVRDRLILLGLFLAGGIFTALLVTGVRNVPT